MFFFTFIFWGIAVWSWGEFNTIKTATEQYITCEDAIKQMQEGSDYLTEQVQLYTMTGEKQYMDNYFKEKETGKKREASLESIKKEFGEIVKPLLSYNQSIKNGEIFPVIGAAELQNLAETYNTMYRDIQETQKLIRHEAENDALTELLNRRYFDKILRIYDEGKSSFALLLNPKDDLPPVSLSVGAAFADRENPGESIFKDADKALYYVKEHGRNGCSFY